MPPLVPWHKVSVPREDLRRAEPLESSQFAVHLDRVAEADGPQEYVHGETFLERTFITEGLRRFTSEVLRRLAGERQGSNAVINLTTQFGGGKTHALTLLYHLSRLGPAANDFPGVSSVLDQAKLRDVPTAAVAVFVGTAWDAVAGREVEGEPARRTPWGDIAWQLAEQTGDPALFEAIKEQDESRIRPGKDVLARILPTDRPVLILMDEVMNFMTAARGISIGGSTLASQFYEFVHNLTEVADSKDGLAVVLSLPKSEEEMSAEDHQDYQRLSKVTARVATPYVLARDLEVPEIVRRRLFDSLGDPKVIRATSQAYARWIADHREQLPKWFPLDDAQETFEANYPFHPVLLSVFERKWQSLPSFQRTRGILRLLAQWVAHAYREGVDSGRAAPMIDLGSAPLDDQSFRTAVLDQLGDERLAAALLSDVAGSGAHAERLDVEASAVLREQSVHRKVATAIFFESSGGQVRQEATLPEIRLSIGSPELDIGNVETALEGLQENCYFLSWEGNRYRFSTKANLNKLLADRRATLDSKMVEERARQAIRQAFGSQKGARNALEVVYFPEDSRAVPDTPSLKLVVLAPGNGSYDAFVNDANARYGQQSRIYKNALVWTLPHEDEAIFEAARRSLAWETISTEATSETFDAPQLEQLSQQRRSAGEALTEAVWRSYRILRFLGSAGEIKEEDLGLLHSSSAESMQALVQARLIQRDELTETLAPSRIIQNWPAGLDEWSLRAVRDAVYASPAFTRLLDPASLRDTIARGVEQGDFGYAAKRSTEYVDIGYAEPMAAADVDFSDDVVLVPAEVARDIKAAQPTRETPVTAVPPEQPAPQPSADPPDAAAARTGGGSGLSWAGEVPAQKWTTFFTRVLSPLQAQGHLKLHVTIDSVPEEGLSSELIEQSKQALDDLGLSPAVQVVSVDRDQADGG